MEQQKDFFTSLQQEYPKGYTKFLSDYEKYRAKTEIIDTFLFSDFCLELQLGLVLAILEYSEVNLSSIALLKRFINDGDDIWAAAKKTLETFLIEYEK